FLDLAGALFKGPEPVLQHPLLLQEPLATPRSTALGSRRRTRIDLEFGLGALGRVRNARQTWRPHRVHRPSFDARTGSLEGPLELRIPGELRSELHQSFVLSTCLTRITQAPQDANENLPGHQVVRIVGYDGVDLLI